MQNSLRLDVSPKSVTIVEATRRVPAVYGGVLHAYAFGAAPAALPGPIELVFSAEYLTRARNGERQAVGEFAKLPAELVVTEAGFEVHVQAGGALPVEKTVEIPEQEHPTAGPLPPLSLSVELGSGFRLLRDENTESAGQSATKNPPSTVEAERALKAQVSVPPPSKPSPYLELCVAVKRDGIELAPASVNGRLDIDTRLLDFLVFNVENERGEAASDVKVEVGLTTGDVLLGQTDGHGRFALNGVPRGECSIFLPEGIKLNTSNQSNESA